MSDVQTWSQTAASNNSASPDGFPEGMAPSGVNDSAREVMAAIAKYRADTDGVNTTTGSSNAYVLAASRTMTAYAQGDLFTFKANFTNTGAATLNVDTLGAKAIQSHTAALVGGEIVSDGVYTVVYDGTQFQLINPKVVSLSAGLGGSLVLLNRTPASGASAVSWNSTHITSTYEKYLITVNDASFSTTADWWFQFSTDNGSTWIGSTSNVYARYGAAVSGNGSNVSIAASTGDSKVVLGAGFTTAYEINANFSFDVASNSTLLGSYGFYASAVSQGMLTCYGSVGSTANAIRFLASTGNISGNYALYGIKKA